MKTISGYCLGIAYIDTRTKSMIRPNSLQIDIFAIFSYRPYRSVIFMSHVPWLGAIRLFYLMLVPDLKKNCLYAQVATTGNA